MEVQQQQHQQINKFDNHIKNTKITKNTSLNVKSTITTTTIVTAKIRKFGIPIIA